MNPVGLQASPILAHNGFTLGGPKGSLAIGSETTRGVCSMHKEGRDRIRDDLALEPQRARIYSLETELKSVYSSTSWKVTSPLRRLGVLFKAPGRTAFDGAVKDHTKRQVAMGPSRDANNEFALLGGLENERARISRLEAKLKSVYSSTSWKITSPLRRLGELFKAPSRSALDKVKKSNAKHQEAVRRAKKPRWNVNNEFAFLGRLEKVYAPLSDRFEALKASIIMPTYNRGFCCTNAIDSVIKQTHSNWELMIIDDGSTDDTPNIISKYLCDDRVRYIRQDNGGVSMARNRGLNLTTGDYVFYLDSDNRWHENYLHAMITYMNACELSCAYSALDARDDSDERRFIRGREFDWLLCLEGNYIDLNAFAHRTDAVGAQDYFDEDLKRLVDWDFILSLTAKNRTAYAPFMGVIYYCGEGGGRITLTQYQGAELENIQEIIRARHRRLNPSGRSEPSDGCNWQVLLDDYLASYE